MYRPIHFSDQRVLYCILRLWPRYGPSVDGFITLRHQYFITHLNMLRGSDVDRYMEPASRAAAGFDGDPLGRARRAVLEPLAGAVDDSRGALYSPVTLAGRAAAAWACERVHTQHATARRAATAQGRRGGDRAPARPAAGGPALSAAAA
eukprot:scaffold121301_cov63-Phaeocystis_antarctica.AAC.1